MVQYTQSRDVPVTFPIAASAPSSCKAAVLLAKVSGKLVPNATIVIPATEALRPTTQPSRFPNYEKNVQVVDVGKMFHSYSPLKVRFQVGIPNKIVYHLPVLLKLYRHQYPSKILQKLATLLELTWMDKKDSFHSLVVIENTNKTFQIIVVFFQILTLEEYRQILLSRRRKGNAASTCTT